VRRIADSISNIALDFRIIRMGSLVLGRTQHESEPVVYLFRRFTCSHQLSILSKSDQRTREITFLVRETIRNTSGPAERYKAMVIFKANRYYFL